MPWLLFTVYCFVIVCLFVLSQLIKCVIKRTIYRHALHLDNYNLSHDNAMAETAIGLCSLSFKAIYLKRTFHEFSTII